MCEPNHVIECSDVDPHTLDVMRIRIRLHADLDPNVRTLPTGTVYVRIKGVKNRHEKKNYILNYYKY